MTSQPGTGPSFHIPEAAAGTSQGGSIPHVTGMFSMHQWDCHRNLNVFLDQTQVAPLSQSQVAMPVPIVNVLHSTPPRNPVTENPTASTSGTSSSGSYSPDYFRSITHSHLRSHRLRPHHKPTRTPPHTIIISSNYIHAHTTTHPAYLLHDHFSTNLRYHYHRISWNDNTLHHIPAHTHNLTSFQHNSLTTTTSSYLTNTLDPSPDSVRSPCTSIEDGVSIAVCTVCEWSGCACSAFTFASYSSHSRARAGWDTGSGSLTAHTRVPSRRVPTSSTSFVWFWFVVDSFIFGAADGE